MTDTRSELLAPSIVVLQNPENLRLRAQRDQLEQLLTRLQDEVAMWKTQIEASNKLEAERVAERNAQRDDQGQNEDVLGSANNGKTPLERMSSKIMRMAVQVEQIQHALEQSKRSVIAAETKRIQLSAHVHEVAQFSVKRPADLIRGLLRQ
jgi:chromosome segregation ATPase